MVKFPIPGSQLKCPCTQRSREARPQRGLGLVQLAGTVAVSAQEALTSQQGSAGASSAQPEVPTGHKDQVGGGWGRADEILKRTRKNKVSTPHPLPGTLFFLAKLHERVFMPALVSSSFLFFLFLG